MELVPIVEITLAIFAGLLTLALAVSYVSARLKRKAKDDFQEGNHAKIINLSTSARQAVIYEQSDVRNFATRAVYELPEPEIRPQVRTSSPAARKTASKFTVLNSNIYDNKNVTVSPQQEIKNYTSGNNTGAAAMFK